MAQGFAVAAVTVACLAVLAAAEYPPELYPTYTMDYDVLVAGEVVLQGTVSCDAREDSSGGFWTHTAGGKGADWDAKVISRADEGLTWSFYIDDSSQECCQEVPKPNPDPVVCRASPFFFEAQDGAEVEESEGPCGADVRAETCVIYTVVRGAQKTIYSYYKPWSMVVRKEEVYRGRGEDKIWVATAFSGKPTSKLYKKPAECPTCIEPPEYPPPLSNTYTIQYNAFDASGEDPLRRQMVETCDHSAKLAGFEWWWNPPRHGDHWDLKGIFRDKVYNYEFSKTGEECCFVSHRQESRCGNSEFDWSNPTHADSVEATVEPCGVDAVGSDMCVLYTLHWGDHVHKHWWHPELEMIVQQEMLEGANHWWWEVTEVSLETTPELYEEPESCECPQ